MCDKCISKKWASISEAAAIIAICALIGFTCNLESKERIERARIEATTEQK